MGQFIDLRGLRFGRWTVIERAENDANKNVRWLCRCDCGTERVVLGTSLRNGRSNSCGCYNVDSHIGKAAHITHGQCRTRIYNIWCGMKSRCYYKRSTRYKHYGGRGITICDEWRNDFQAFYDWAIANGYRDDLSIDRINVDGNYEPTNCRWATRIEQANNKRKKAVTNRN